MLDSLVDRTREARLVFVLVLMTAQWSESSPNSICSLLPIYHANKKDIRELHMMIIMYNSPFPRPNYLLNSLKFESSNSTCPTLVTTARLRLPACVCV